MSEIKYVTPSGLAHYDEKIKEVIDKVDTSTNTKVTQTPTSTDASYPLLLSPSGQTQETNTTSYFNSGVVLNPSTKTISANIDGNAKTATKATSADKLNANAGSATQPTYFADGIPKACTHTLEKSVPADAVFTDTTYIVETSMVGLGFTNNATYTVHEFFVAIYEKRYSGKISLRFGYGNSATAKISDGTTTIDMNGADCYLSCYGDITSPWKKNYAIVSIDNKMYLLYEQYDASSTPVSQGIINLRVATSCTGNSATATKATQDGNGKEISKTYLPLAGGTMEDDAEIKALNGRLDIATIVGTGTGYGTSIEGIIRNKVFEIDLTDTAIYDKDKYYPVVGSVIQRQVGLIHIKATASLTYSGVPSWSTHTKGFHALLDLLVLGDYYGEQYPWSICLCHTCMHTYNELNPLGYSQLSRDGRPVFWLRGGGKYKLYADYNCKWTIYTELTYFNGQSVEPTTTNPGVSLAKSTVYANLYGNSATATKATQDGSGNTITSTYAKKSIYGDTVVSMGRKANTTVGENSFAFGNDVTASGDYSCAFGNNNIASSIGTFAAGMDNEVSSTYSAVFGLENIVSNAASLTQGRGNTVTGIYSLVNGLRCTGLQNQLVHGHHNNTTTATENSYNGTSDGTAFVIGNGSSGSKSNAFRVTGKGVIYATNATVQTGADYAEYFEWSDGNPNEEDRVGYFVTFDEDNPEKIRIASKDDYILGIVSGMPNIIGNGDECWKQRYILDDFGRYIEEAFEYEVEVPEVVEKEVEDEETGETKIVEEVVVHKETKTGTKWKENPEYDPTKPYIPRDKRAEWSAIGMLGVLSVRDDGTCQVNGYCKVADSGIATACEKDEGYRIIKRVTDNVVKVVLK